MSSKKYAEIKILLRRVSRSKSLQCTLMVFCGTYRELHSKLLLCSTTLNSHQVSHHALTDLLDAGLTQGRCLTGCRNLYKDILGVEYSCTIVCVCK